MAQRFGLIVAMRGKFTEHISAMKTANPSLQIAVYQNATFGGSSFTEDMYAHDRYGARIHAIKWPTTFLMQLDSPKWTNFVTTNCRDLITKSRYDTCYLDVLGNGPLISVYLNAKPVTKTGTEWTPLQWIGWTTALAGKVGSGLGKTTYGNGLGAGYRYFSPTLYSRPLVSTSGQVAAESFVRDAHDSATKYRNETMWKQDVDMLVDAEAQGKGALTITKVWTTATTAQINSLHEYALGTFLLGSGGKSRFCFLREKGNNASAMDHPYNRVDPGNPIAAYRFADGIYQRDFTRGRVLVNPKITAVTVPLARTYTTLSGQTVSGSITVAPRTARILTW